MKKLLSMVLCAMMALTLAGCGGSSDDSSTYTYSSELDIKNLDSSDADDGCSFTALHAIIDGLMKPAKDGTTTYGIAKSSEVSEDGQRIRPQKNKTVADKWHLPPGSHPPCEASHPASLQVRVLPFPEVHRPA